MERRSFLKNTAAAAGTGALAAPALAQGTVNWRMASSFPKTLDAIYGPAEQFIKRIAQL
ncbi:MAG TPA: twin-arginine translocation signal domain-containing protein, partial [Pseudoduganella sp.]